MGDSKILYWFKNFMKKIKNRIKLLPENTKNEEISKKATNNNKVIKEEVDAFDYVSRALENNSSYHEIIKINSEINDYKHKIREDLDKIKNN